MSWTTPMPPKPPSGRMSYCAAGRTEPWPESGYFDWTSGARNWPVRQMPPSAEIENVYSFSGAA